MSANDLSNICDVNILTKYPKKGDLLNYLNNLHHALSVTTQEVSDRPKGLKSISKQLVSSKLLAYNDKDVRLLTTCCIADILRVFAPEAPYNNEDTILAFNAINSQIRGLATYDSMESILSSKVFYILNSIATVQSCVVPVILAQSGVHGAADTVINMFDAILSSIRTEHPEEVFASTASVLQACIEECEGVGEDLLDILLLPLLPHSKLDNPAAYQLAGTVLRRVANSIKSPITAFINRILVGASHEYAVQGSDLREHVYSLIYELHRVSADLLHGVLPNVCLQLQVEELDVRFRAVKVLSSLFASTYADYAKEFARNFKEYLGRLNDISVDIRLEVVESCAVIVQNKPSLLSLIEEPLAKRLRDADERVRLAALTKLIDLCYFGPKEFSTHTFLEMGERVKDRRMEVKRLAMIGLAKIYNKHISSTLPPIRSLVGSSSSSSHPHSMRSLIDQSLLDRLDFIPGFLMKCWSYPEAINKYLIVQLLQEQLLPKQSAASSTDGGPPQGTEKAPAVAAVAAAVVSKSSKNKSSAAAENKSGPESSDICDRRATALVLMFELLTKSDRAFLASIMTFKAKVRSELLTFMSIRSKSLGPVDSRSSQTQQTLIERRMSSHPQLSSILSTEDSVKLLRTCIVKVMQLIPAMDKKATYLEKLYSVKDRVVFRLLDHCINAEDSIASSIRNREELKKRLDSKSPMGEYMGSLYDIAGSLVVNRTSVQSLLHFVTHLSISPDAVVPSELLVFLSKHSSHTFQGEGGVDCLTDWFVHLMDDTKTKYKDTRALLSMHCLSVINFTCQAFEFEDEHQSQLCASIIAQIKKNTSPETCVKLAELCSQMAYYSQPDGYGKGQGESALSLIETLFDALSTNKGLSKNNKRLDSDLGALSALCSVPKAAYIALNFTKPSLLSFMSKVMSRRNSIVEFTKGILYRAEGSVEESVSVYTLGVCLRLLTNVLSTEEEWHHLQGSCSDGSHRPPTHSDFKALVTLLFECIDSKGQQLHNYSIAARMDQDYLFETASDCAVSMIKLNAFAVETTVDQWHALGWTFLHPDENIRSRLLGTLTTTIQLYFVHSKFLTYPCLFVPDETLYPIAQQALTVNVKRLRISYDELCTLQIEDSGARAIQKQTESCMPEAILPYLLHLLSYHPDFPTSISIDTDADRKRMMSVVRSVRMLLEVLQSTLTVDSDNMSYLFKQLNSINQHYVDKHDSDNIGLHFVTRLAVKHLHEQIKTSDNLQVYPGDIVLPRQLYKLKSSQGHTSSDDQASNAEEVLQAKEGLEDAENAIDKVLQFANRSRGVRNATGGSRRAVTSHRDDLVGSGSKPRNSKKRLSDNSFSSISPHDPDALQDHKKRQPTTAEKGKRQQQSWSGEKVGRDERPQEGSHSASKSKLPVEAPTRNMPKRGAKEVVTSYAIPTESDREMLRWEEDAARTKRPKSSELHLLQGYSGTTAQVDIRRLSSGVVNRSSSSSAGVILTEDDSITRAEERGITDRELTESQESAVASPTKASADNSTANKSNGTKDKRAHSSKGGGKQNPAVASRRTAAQRT